jgi:hypothetical protein
VRPLLAGPAVIDAQPAGKKARVVKTAKTLGLSIPPSALLRADHVVD